MVMTKSGKNTNPADTADTSKQAQTATLTLTAQTIQPTMKFDSALQHILDTVLDLRQEHCIRLCFDNNGICTLQEILSLERDNILEPQYKDQSGTVLPIKSMQLYLFQLLNVCYIFYQVMVLLYILRLEFYFL